MILLIILFVMIIISVIMLILFSIYVLLPSIDINENMSDDPVIPQKIQKNLFESEETNVTDLKAVVLCSHKKNTTLAHSNFNEENTCFMIKNVFGTGFDCPFACLGLGDCMENCPQEAIFIENNTAVISDNCCGCGECVNICPQNLIKLIPKNEESIILCNNDNKNNLTSCSEFQKEKNIEVTTKKDFKIYSKCYKMLKKVFKK